MLEKTVSPEKPLLENAILGTEQKWLWWQDDFLHNGPFKDMPVLQSYPRFRGFGADYSVFRGWSAEQCSSALNWFRVQNDPVNFDALYYSFMQFCEADELLRQNLQQRVSLISKLLTMWKPREFSMWDTLAREGMRQVHGRTRGHNYWQTDALNYNIFNNDFKCLHKHWETELNSAVRNSKVGDELDENLRESFSARVLDNYLMTLGNVK